MPRVNQAEVKAIISTTEIDIQPFITAANLVVTNNLSSSGYDVATLKEIERWLAAHFLAVSKEASSTVVEHQVGDSRIRYPESSLGAGLKGSRYGHQVLLLDTNGLLAALGKVRAVIDSVLVNQTAAPGYLD